MGVLPGRILGDGRGDGKSRHLGYTGESEEAIVATKRRTAKGKRTLELVKDAPDRAMVIFAHPDDAEIGSGGVIAKWVATGCEVTYVLCTNGSAGTADRTLSPTELVDQRAAEQRAAADFMGVKNLVMLRHP